MTIIYFSDIQQLGNHYNMPSGSTQDGRKTSTSTSKRLAMGDDAPWLSDDCDLKI